MNEALRRRIRAEQPTVSRLVRRLLLLREVHGLSLQDMQQRLRRLKDLHVGSLGLLDCLVVLVPGLRFPDKTLVDLLEPVGEKRELLLDLTLVLLLFHDLLVQLLALLTQILNALDKLVVVVLQRCTLSRHGAATALRTKLRAL